MFKLIFWIVVLILILSYLGISLQEIITSPAGQENIQYVFHLLNQGWQWITGQA